MPHDLNWHLALTRQQVDWRAELGDQLATARMTDHSAEFRKRHAAEAAAQELRGLGYAVTVARSGFTKVLLEASKQSSVELATADSFVHEVFGIISKHGGEYDGWGGEVEK